MSAHSGELMSDYIRPSALSIDWLVEATLLSRRGKYVKRRVSIFRCQENQSVADVSCLTLVDGADVKISKIFASEKKEAHHIQTFQFDPPPPFFAHPIDRIKSIY
jgi:hypothetical protein